MDNIIETLDSRRRLETLKFSIEEKTENKPCSWCDKPINGYSFVVLNRFYHHNCYDAYEDLYYKINKLYPDLQEIDRTKWDFNG